MVISGTFNGVLFILFYYYCRVHVNFFLFFFFSCTCPQWHNKGMANCAFSRPRNFASKMVFFFFYSTFELAIQNVSGIV